MHPEMKKLVVRAKEMGIPNNLELAMYLINLENRIKELQEHLESQIDRVAYHHERHVERHEKRKYNKR